MDLTFFESLGLVEGNGDLVTSNWFSACSEYYPFGVIILYIISVTIVANNMPKKMNSFVLSVTYNSFQICLKMYIFLELVSVSSWSTLWCGPVFSTESAQGHRMAAAVWWFHMAKYLDLIDTILIIMKGNRAQLTKMHIFHHSSMIIYSWVYIRHAPISTGYFIVLLNNWVHSITHGFFILTGFKELAKKVRFLKKFLRIIQIAELLIAALHAFVAILHGCSYKRSILVSGFAYALILLVIYTRFYFHSNFKKKV